LLPNLFDEEGRKLGPIGIPIVNDERYDASWSDDNLTEIDKGWIKKGNSLEDIAAQIDVNPKVLRATVERWNDLCAKGQDEDYKRPPKTMMPIKNGPFYVMEAWPIVNNTQGGPEHDVNQRVLDPMKRPIRAFMSPERSARSTAISVRSGNITECFVAGKIAGQNAAAEQPWC
jgi:succinate dehydrogenase/fumarate reductase flavoprotein subunit